jgi:hypothetical protein
MGQQKGGGTVARAAAPVMQICLRMKRGRHILGVDELTDLGVVKMTTYYWRSLQTLDF